VGNAETEPDSCHGATLATTPHLLAQGLLHQGTCHQASERCFRTRCLSRLALLESVLQLVEFVGDSSSYWADAFCEALNPNGVPGFSMQTASAEKAHLRVHAANRALKATALLRRAPRVVRILVRRLPALQRQDALPEVLAWFPPACAPAACEAFVAHWHGAIACRLPIEDVQQTCLALQVLANATGLRSLEVNDNAASPGGESPALRSQGADAHDSAARLSAHALGPLLAKLQQLQEVAIRTNCGAVAAAVMQHLAAITGLTAVALHVRRAAVSAPPVPTLSMLPQSLTKLDVHADLSVACWRRISKLTCLRHLSVKWVQPASCMR
jgi:hypothetical protein